MLDILHLNLINQCVGGNIIVLVPQYYAEAKTVRLNYCLTLIAMRMGRKSGARPSLKTCLTSFFKGSCLRLAKSFYYM